MDFLDRFKASPVDPAYPDWLRTFYSPVDDVHGVLKTLIDRTQKSLVLAMYGFDDDELADSVARRLADTGIYCQITLDKSQAGGMHEKALIDKYHMLDSNSVAIGT